MERQQHHFGLGLRVSNDAGSFQAVQHRHRNVHDDDFRSEGIGEPYCFLSIVGLATEFPLRERMQNSLDSPPNCGVIIDNQYSRHVPSRLVPWRRGTLGRRMPAPARLIQLTEELFVLLKLRFYNLI